MIRIFIVDDHVFIREGLKQVLSNESDLQIVGEASKASEALDKMMKVDFDIALLDINLPGRNGLELAEELKQLKPSVHVLTLSMYPEDRFAIRALKTGISGYITKDSSTEELVKAIHTVADRGKYISPKVAQLLADSIENPKNKELHEGLSNREFEIMCRVASGKSVKEIADDLALSVSSVNSYRSRIFEKMKMHSNVELIFYAIRYNLIDFEI